MTPEMESKATVGQDQGAGRLLELAVGVGLITLFVVHLVCVSAYFVDIPYWDSWEYLRPDGLSRDLDPAWFFRAHNDHIILPTRVQTWLLYLWTNWDIEFHLWVNFFLWGVQIVLTILVLRRFAGKLPAWMVMLFVAFQMSGISYENHGWSFQSQFHWCLLFLMSALYFLFDPRQRGTSLVLGALSLLFCLFSFAAGMAASLAVMLGFVSYRLVRSVSPESQTRARDWIQVLVVLSIYLGGVILWSSLLSNHEPSPFNIVLPYQDRFWKFFLKLAAFGWGFHEESWPFVHFAAVHKHLYLLVDFVLLVLIVAPCVGLLKRFRSLGSQEFGVMAGMLAVLGMLAAISMGRAEHMHTAFSSRYTEIAVLIVPFGMLAWQHVLAGRPHLRLASYGLLVVICLLGFHDDWNYTAIYRHWITHRIQAVEEVVDYYKKGGSSQIPALYPFDLKPKLDRAMDIEVSFYKRWVLEQK